MSDTEEKPIILHTDDMIKLGNEIRRLEAELEKHRTRANKAEVDLKTLRKQSRRNADDAQKMVFIRDIFERANRNDMGVETTDRFIVREIQRILKPPVCLGCGKTHTECKCTEEEIEYHKRLEREQKAE